MMVEHIKKAVEASNGLIDVDTLGKFSELLHLMEEQGCDSHEYTMNAFWEELGCVIDELQ